MDGDFLVPEASRHLDSVRPALSPVMRRVEEEAVREREPAVNPDTGALLRVLVAATGGRRVLEVGTNLGYGALWMAGGLAPGGRIETIELDGEVAARARANFAEAGLGERIEVLEGAALDVLPGLPSGAYDLVFLDCVKAEYPAYLEHARRLLRVGGIVAADNLFWHGKAWDETADDEDTLALRAYSTAVRSDARLATTIVPVGDGLAVSVLLP